MTTETTKNMVKHPDHYDEGDPIYEPYRVINAWKCNFNIGSAIKYLARYKKKWNPIEDLEKAKEYIDFEIEALKSEGYADKQRMADIPRKVVLNGNNAQETVENPEESKSRELTDEEREFLNRICRDDHHEDDRGVASSNIGKLIDKAITALDSGKSKTYVMKEILGLSDEEIERLSSMDNPMEVCNAVAQKLMQGISKEIMVPDNSKKYFVKSPF